MEGYFIVLVVIGNKELLEADNLISSCTDYVQKLYEDTAFTCKGKWLMIEVRDMRHLSDVIKLIELKSI